VPPSEQIGDLWVFTNGVLTETREYLNDMSITPEMIAQRTANAAARLARSCRPPRALECSWLSPELRKAGVHCSF